MRRDWLHVLGKSWGRHLRRQPNGYPGESLMYRIWRQGPDGAAIKSYGTKVLVRDTPEEVLVFHRAWAEVKDGEVLWVFYVTTGSAKTKSGRLSCSPQTMYRRLDAAQRDIEALLLLGKNCVIFEQPQS